MITIFSTINYLIFDSIYAIISGIVIIAIIYTIISSIFLLFDMFKCDFVIQSFENSKLNKKKKIK